MVDVAVIGAAGYAGIEAVRWVLAHPRLNLALATSAADAGRPIVEVYPALRGMTELRFEAPEVETVCARASVSDSRGAPHRRVWHSCPGYSTQASRLSTCRQTTGSPTRMCTSAGTVSRTLPRRCCPRPSTVCPSWTEAGLLGARLVACPGCYPTAAILAAFPSLEAGLADSSRVVVDAKSGVSGAGRSVSPGTHFVAADEALTPYKVGVHRHTPEMAQALSSVVGGEVSVVFTPHLVPMSRGLLATVYLEGASGVTTEKVIEAYRARFDGEPFVHVHDAGVMPSTAEVRNTNRASIGVHVDASSSTVVVACAIDNLGKGSAGQGVQCLNAVLGFPETEGLAGPFPVV